MRRIVLTGGPGAGKTIISTEIARRHPDCFVRVPEAATQVYQMLRTRWDRLDPEGRRDVQRRIYHLQVEQEEAFSGRFSDKTLLLDRGTVDGAAYWPEGAEDYWRDLGTAYEKQLARYDAVIWMQSCAAIGVYDGEASNLCRFEDAAAALAGGEGVAKLWSAHPRLHIVHAQPSIELKIAAVEELVGRLVMA